MSFGLPFLFVDFEISYHCFVDCYIESRLKMCWTSPSDLRIVKTIDLVIDRLVDDYSWVIIIEDSFKLLCKGLCVTGKTEAHHTKLRYNLSLVRCLMSFPFIQAVWFLLRHKPKTCNTRSLTLKD